jgi:hypothetical protein
MNMTNLHFHGLHVSPNAPQDDVLTMMAMPGQSLHFLVRIHTLLDVAPMLLLQPVIQYYANVGGGVRRAIVFGFRTKVEF